MGRIVVNAGLQVVLWLLPPKLTRALIYGPCVVFLLIPGVALELRIGVVLAVAHGLIHHAWPFISSEGWDARHSPAPDVLCHSVMLIYAHSIMGHRLLGFEAPITWLTYSMLALGAINCVLATRVQTSDENHDNTIASDDPQQRWFSLTSISQAYSSGYVMMAMLFFAAPTSATLIWAWLLFVVVYLGVWLYFVVSDVNEQSVLGGYFRRGYFEFSFIVPAYLGVIYAL